MFYNICQFKSLTITNYIIMTSLPKNNGKIQTSPIRNKIYIIRKVLLNLSHCVKRYGHFCQILALLMIPTHQIWSCHLTQDANFENFLFCPNSTFNIGKSRKISSGKALYFLLQKLSAKTSPVPLGLKQYK